MGLKMIDAALTKREGGRETTIDTSRFTGGKPSRVRFREWTSFEVITPPVAHEKILEIVAEALPEGVAEPENDLIVSNIYLMGQCYLPDADEIGIDAVALFAEYAVSAPEFFYFVLAQFNQAFPSQSPDALKND